MAGTVRIWWHQGAQRDQGYNSMPLVREPEISTETVALNGAAEVTGPAPKLSSVALIKSDVDFAYVVRLAGETVQADPQIHKPVGATGTDLYAIGIPEGASISLVEMN